MYMYTNQKLTFFRGPPITSVHIQDTSTSKKQSKQVKKPLSIENHTSFCIFYELYFVITEYEQ